MIYLIQATLYTAILYMVYLLFLKNRTDHTWSRAYLLMNMTLPFVLPFISMPLPGSQQSTMREVMLPVVTIGTQVSEQAKEISILPIIYIAVSSILLGYFITQAVQIALFIKRHSSEQYGNIRLIRNANVGPGSWLGYVFIPGTEADPAVLKHEEAHVYYKHSYDIIFVRMLQCVAWPNAMLLLVIKELKTVHEFQADAVAAKNKETYNSTLLNELFHTKHFPLSHTFFHHPIKRRIMMLQKKNARAGKMKVVTLSMLLLTGMLYIQCSNDATAQTAIQQSQTPDETGVYSNVDKMPEFYSTISLPKYLMTAVRYPEAAKEKKIGGRVVVKFIVDEEGKITNAKVIESPDESLSASALAAVNNMPRWKPGEKNGNKVKVYYTLPLSYVPDIPKETNAEKAMRQSFLMGQTLQSEHGETKIYPSDGC